MVSKAVFYQNEASFTEYIKEHPTLGAIEDSYFADVSTMTMIELPSQMPSWSPSMVPSWSPSVQDSVVPVMAEGLPSSGPTEEPSEAVTEGVAAGTLAGVGAAAAAGSAAAASAAAVSSLLVVFYDEHLFSLYYQCGISFARICLLIFTFMYFIKIFFE